MVGCQGQHAGIASMILLIIIWALAYATALGIGTALLPTPTHTNSLIPIKRFLVGLAIITALGNCWSLFFPITPHLVILLLLLGGYGLIKGHVELKEHFRNIQVKALVLIILSLAALCLSLTATTNIDEAGYYLPLVKWIESYPVVPGIALLNHRIGFNSGFHMLSAVFGFVPWIAGGVYKLNGLLFIVFNFYFLQRLRGADHYQKLQLPDALLAGALVFPFSFLLNSMDSDYLGIMGAVVLIAWSLEALQKKTSVAELLTLIAIGLFLFTIRPFNAFLLAAPAWIILTQKAHRKRIILYFMWGLILVLPWFIRNYFLSGYLIFPIHFVDLFSPEWKVPAQVTIAAHDIISEFAKLEIVRPEYLYDSMTHPSLSQWWPVWLERSWGMLIGKTVIALTPLSLLIVLASAFGLKKTQLSKSSFFFLLYAIPIIAIWFCNYPSIRFGWAWLLFLITGAGFIFWNLIKLPTRYFILGLMLLVTLSWLRLFSNLDYGILIQHPIKPSVVKVEHPYTEKHSGTITLKYSIDPHCYGVEPPCLPYNNPLDIVPRGQTIEEGFRLK